MTGDLWTRIERLRGLTIRTVTGKPFHVVSVDHEQSAAITIIPLSTGRQRIITAREIEDGYALSRRLPNMTPAMIREHGVSETNPAYVVAILTAVEGDKN